MKVAFQGEPGAYSEEACLRAFDDSVESVGYQTLDDVVSALIRGEVEAAVLPAENSVAGTIARTYELLLEYSLSIWRDVYQPIRHNLLALPGVRLTDVKRVYSHPQALEQCHRFVEVHRFEPVPQLDTAGSARMVAETGLRDAAAIASRRAAQLYGLQILAYDIQDLAGNTTRFFVVGLSPKGEIQGKAKVSTVFSVPDVPGALYKTLGVFNERQLNLTKVESRPDRMRHWRYLFYLDFEIEDATQAQSVIDELSARTEFLRVLGVYPSAEPNGNGL